MEEEIAQRIESQKVEEELYAISWPWLVWLWTHNTCDDLLWAYQWAIMDQGGALGIIPFHAELLATNDFSEKGRVYLQL